MCGVVLLYNSPVSGNCYKVRLLLAHLGIPYERRDLDVVDRSNRGEVLRGLNPDLRVPTLVLDDGRPLAESGAILWYFGAYSGQPERYVEVIERKTVDWYRALDALEGHLAGSGESYVVGAALTLADIALYAYTHVAHEGGFDLSSHPSIRNWLDRVSGEPGHVAIDA